MATASSKKKTLLGLGAGHWLIIGVIVLIAALLATFEYLNSNQSNLSGGLARSSVDHSGPHKKTQPLQPHHVAASVAVQSSQGVTPAPVAQEPTGSSTTGTSAALASVNETPQDVQPSAVKVPAASTVTNAQSAGVSPTVTQLTDTTAQSASFVGAHGDKASSNYARQDDIAALTQSLSALEARIAALSQTVDDANGKIAKLQTEIKAVRAEHSKTRKSLHLTQAELERERAKARAAKASLAARPVLPGWTVEAIAGQSAVLAGPNNAMRLVHVGDTLFGLKIEAINAKQNVIKTTGGVITAGEG